jgi:hypothetical protein
VRTAGKRPERTDANRIVDAARIRQSYWIASPTFETGSLVASDTADLFALLYSVLL